MSNKKFISNTMLEIKLSSFEDMQDHKSYQIIIYIRIL